MLTTRTLPRSSALRTQHLKLDQGLFKLRQLVKKQLLERPSVKTINRVTFRQLVKCPTLQNASFDELTIGEL